MAWVREGPDVARRWRLRAWVVLALGGGQGCGSGGDSATTGPSNLDPIDPRFPCGTVEVTELEPASLELTAWARQVAGHHEASLAWERRYSMDVVHGFDPRSALSVDVAVLGGRRYVYSEGACADGEYLDIEAQLATADGALHGTFRQTLSRLQDERGRDVLVSNGGWDNGYVPLDHFSGTFVLGVDPVLAIDPALELERWLGVVLRFSERGLSGVLRPLVHLPQEDTALPPPAFTPIEGVFPEKDCEGTLVTVAEASDELAVAAQSAYEVVARAWPSGPIPASWTLVLDELSRTEASLTLGPPTHGCLDAEAGNTVFAPVHVETADGRVDHTTDIAWRLDAAGNVTSDMRSTWVPVAEFERVIGVRGMDFEAARYATASFQNTIAPASDVFSGAMFCSSSDPYVYAPYILPVLSWCSGTGCSEDRLDR